MPPGHRSFRPHWPRQPPVETRPPTETQRTSVFVEVDQVSLKGTVSRIFTGWMFADSPALNAIDHAVYDIWLIDCKTTPPSVTPSDGQQ